MLYELRIYHCLPNKLPLLNKRFEIVTLAMWERHGIRQVGFWTVAIGESNHDLYYMLEWQSLAEREKKWNTFATDPAWLAAKAETEKDGPIISHFTNYMLSPTSYSKLK